MFRSARRTLRCSFCRKRDADVQKLIGGPRLAGGPKVYICDACVGVCNRILEATPQAFAGWDGMTDTQLLGSLAPANASLEGVRAVLQAQVDALRERGVSWADIGKALGISRQAAWERFS
ncbi:MAG TPA: ClpX C4-type zinc finger protein [Vicinamibacterales bacterium]|nr:ClpX C4-type zinc finger protein [Vicinamibacterales bacterium]